MLYTMGHYPLLKYEPDPSRKHGVGGTMYQAQAT